jgi:hypothetical protein
MIVITIDQRASRTRPDHVDALIQRLNGSYETLRRFERTAGDELQGVLENGRVACALALDVARTADWSVGIGVGAVRAPLPRQTRAGAGEAFEMARLAVERAKNAPASIAVAGPGGEAGRIEAELQLVADIGRRRSKASEEAGTMVSSGLSQKEAAARLGISQQAVSSRLASGLWHQCQNLAAHAAEALDRYSRESDGGR